MVEAKPDELIAVRRKDLKGKKAIRAALLDNRTAETAEWDPEVLSQLAASDSDLMAGIFSEEELADQSVDLKAVDTKPPPKMTWVLLGIPTVRFGEISEALEKLAAIPNVICETTSNDG